MPVARVVVPVPQQDSDPSEVAVSWQGLSEAGHEVVFATPDGKQARCDELMVTGVGLDPWGWIPGLRRLVAVGRVLRADAAARAAHSALLESPEWRAPERWDQVALGEFDGMLLPGGHRARGMREYLESPVLQGLVATAFQRDLPVAAICHGTLLAARSINPDTGRSVLHGRLTTALTWQLEHTAWQVARWTRFWDRDYYRTYLEGPDQPDGYMSVQQEVTRALATHADFLDAPPDDATKRSGRTRDTAEDDRPAFIVQDGNYLSARWPGDVHTFTRRFAHLVTPHRKTP
ncbi:type 1 glutamine amidotransferase domain-containing protein [Amycolatopsis sp. H20-H5]|uniref:type 1 glutamine amidotransferase domain-containing protein n=1 Tax=Amycolatopsis sp. H20-H5 TaxID=3046309 RepID=UPI002DBE009F|nr:type 1 glutamine amidotransferase domain-containing protein [Amycolatopsis sp. H20-H5]MEC3978463.1 type 1 glutamine amidotransferase domain-containing protein [Amycolatopsis sp. H20-H5]